MLERLNYGINPVLKKSPVPPRGMFTAQDLSNMRARDWVASCFDPHALDLGPCILAGDLSLQFHLWLERLLSTMIQQRLPRLSLKGLSSKTLFERYM